MPDDKEKGSDNSDVSLYLCTECQQSRYVLYGNRYTNLKKNHIDSVIKLSDGFQDGAAADYHADRLDQEAWEPVLLSGSV